MDLKHLEQKTHYELLGVPNDATPEQIKEVYRDLARAYHPDSKFYTEIIGEAPSAEQIAFFKIITAAYNTLIDPVKRAEYDRLLSRDNSPVKIRDWDEKLSPEFWKNQQTRRQSSGCKGKGIRGCKSGVFGRPEYRRGVGAEDKASPGTISPSMAELLKSRARSKLWTILLAFSGLMVGALVGAVVYLLYGFGGG